ncbi:MAG TPA: M48 family metalloprotease [Puia sp.]|nr:M48 family metalloprotease [Puia sp.]
MLSVALPYHLKVRDHFSEQRKTWDFFTATGTGSAQQASYKTDLLKNTYKFQPETDLFIYDKIAFAKEKLGLSALQVTAYQAQYANDLNASITYFDQEAQLVFSGDLTQRLNGDELLAVIAHELAHVKLFSLLNGELEVADRIITAIANNNTGGAASVAPYYETARLFRLYTEIYCDRAALAVLGDPVPVINMLLKIATGLATVDAESYSKQAEEIFSASPDTLAATPTHPENFIRTRALGLWFEKQEAAEPEIARMIEGLPDLDRLDIFSQKELAALTRDFLSYYLRPKWFQSPLVISLARQYFPDHPWEGPVAPRTQPVGQGRKDDDEGRPGLIAAKIAAAHASVKEYFAYLLLDFALADPSLEEIPSGRAFQLAEEMQLSEVYDLIAKKEMQFSDKKWPGYKQQTQAAYALIKEA